MNDDLPLTSALDEETARAELYGVISELFYAPLRAELLAQLRLAPTEAPQSGSFLEEPWRQLVGSARAMTDAEIASEYDTLFGGIGKPEVYLIIRKPSSYCISNSILCSLIKIRNC